MSVSGNISINTGLPANELPVTGARLCYTFKSLIRCDKLLFSIKFLEAKWLNAVVKYRKAGISYGFSSRKNGDTRTPWIQESGQHYVMTIHTPDKTSQERSVFIK